MDKGFYIMSTISFSDRKNKINKTIMYGGGTFKHTQNWDLIGKVLAEKARKRAQPSGEII